MLARVLALLMLAAVPAAADPIVCAPPPGHRLAVTGVPGWDSLNVRAGPGTGYRVLGTVGPNADHLVATGRVGFLSQLCRVACDQYRAGVPGFADIVERDCRARSQIWYELRTPGGMTGWSSARYLNVRPPAPRPPGIIVPPHPGGDRPIVSPPDPGGNGDRPVIDPPPPGPGDSVLRFACENGERLTVTLRHQGNEAVVRLRDGRSFALRRMPGPAEINYATPAHGGLALEGDRGGVHWKGPGSHGSTRCFGAA